MEPARPFKTSSMQGKEKITKGPDYDIDGIFITTAEDVNAGGHKQELDRNFSLLSVSAVGIVSDNAWAFLGGSIVVAIANGGPPGVIYEFIAASLFYVLITASLAELASAAPSSGGVYHWASITAGNYGRVCGFYAGFWNFFAWMFGAAGSSLIIGNMALQMYAAYHPEFEAKSWHVFVCYLIVTWCSCCVVLFANRALPILNSLALFLMLAGFLITVVVCAAMPGTGGRPPHASSAFVFRNWSADIGYSSNGFVFLMGMLNGAYAIGTPDFITHLAEEIPRPEINIPKAMAVQVTVGIVTTLSYAIAILFAVHDLNAVLSSSSILPIAEIYRQATGSRAGMVGLLVVIFLPLVCGSIDTYVTAGRILWALARDNATPFEKSLSRVHPRRRNPFNATVVCGCISTILGCIYVGSTTAFNAFVGSFVLLTTSSYLAVILPHILSRRSNVLPGPFWMKGVLGYAIHGMSCLYIAVFIVIFCFPYKLPVQASNMNYSSLILGGVTIFVSIIWIFKGRKGYTGPQALHYRGRKIDSIPMANEHEV